MNKILLIGCGRLGQCYLRSIKEKVFYQTLITVDPFWDQADYSNVSDIDSHLKFDLAIIVTCADVRFSILNTILNKFSIDYLILEKVLFQKSTDYDLAYQLLQKHKVKAWVNCPRRTYQCYRDIKSSLRENQTINMEVTGNNWGLACNSIHLIDLFCYLVGSSEITFEINTDMDVIPSKRAGFYEILGKITGKVGDSRIEVSCYQDDEFSLVKKLKIGENRSILIHNQSGKLRIEDNMGSLSILSHYQVPYVSEFIGDFINDVLLGHSILPEFSETYKIHQRLIDLFTSIFSEKQIKDCPIT